MLKKTRAYSFALLSRQNTLKFIQIFQSCIARALYHKNTLPMEKIVDIFVNPIFFIDSYNVSIYSYRLIIRSCMCAFKHIFGTRCPAVADIKCDKLVLCKRRVSPYLVVETCTCEIMSKMNNKAKH